MNFFRLKHSEIIQPVRASKKLSTLEYPLSLPRLKSGVKGATPDRGSTIKVKPTTTRTIKNTRSFSSFNTSFSKNIKKSAGPARDPVPKKKRFFSNDRKSMPELNIKSTNKLNYVSKCVYKTRIGENNGKKKPNNQDSFIICPYLQSKRNQYLFAVLDGHGPNGHIVSNYMKFKLGKEIENALKIDSLSKGLTMGIANSIKLLEQSDTDLNFSGSTLNLVLIRNKRILCANIGDSRAVIGRKTNEQWTALQLTTDHKPELPQEKERILSVGGRIAKLVDPYGEPVGPDRVWFRNEEFPGLAMSRSIGDKVAHYVGVVDTPEFAEYEIAENDKFIILASDGLWDFVSNEEAVEIVGKAVDSEDTGKSCYRLIKEASERWRREINSVDDITIIVVFLNKIV